MEERNDVAEGNVWPDPPRALVECVDAGTHLESCDGDGYCNVCGYQDPAPEEEGELGPCPFGPPCTNESHHELARIQAADRAAERRYWRRQKTSRGMDPGLFC